MVESSSEGRGIGGEYGRKDVPVRKIFTPSGVTIFEPGNGAYYHPIVSPSRPIHITEAGMDCLHFLAQGMSNKEIAVARNTAIGSVKNTFTSHVFKPLGAKGRDHAIVQAIRKGFLTMDDLGLVGLDAQSSKKVVEAIGFLPKKPDDRDKIRLAKASLASKPSRQ